MCVYVFIYLFINICGETIFSTSFQIACPHFLFVPSDNYYLLGVCSSKRWLSVPREGMCSDDLHFLLIKRVLVPQKAVCVCVCVVIRKVLKSRKDTGSPHWVATTRVFTKTSR